MIEINTPQIKTERLILRKFVQADAHALFLILSDKEANTFLPWFPFKTIEEARQHLQAYYINSYASPIGFRYAICFRQDDIPIGYIHVGEDDSHDFGYGLRKEFWHKGIMSEACKAVVDQLGEAGMPYITATHDINNPHSGAVMKKIGMTYQYSYEELVQPKNMLVCFRMFQLNFNESTAGTYQKYWNKYANHFIEKDI